MAEQVRRSYTPRQRAREQEQADQHRSKPQLSKEDRARLKEHLDELLDEIDGVLEEDTALLDYRQQGGE